MSCSFQGYHQALSHVTVVFNEDDGKRADVREAQKVVRGKIKLPPGFAITCSGQYESMERVNKRLLVVVPVTGLLILGLLYLNTRSQVKTAIVTLAVPFSAIGAIWFLIRIARGHRSRRGKAHKTDVHDGGHRLHRTGSDSVGHGRRIG